MPHGNWVAILAAVPHGCCQTAPLCGFPAGPGVYPGGSRQPGWISSGNFYLPFHNLRLAVCGADFCLPLLGAESSSSSSAVAACAVLAPFNASGGMPLFSTSLTNNFASECP